jgi:CBS-domain-containing membrane protein
MRVFNIMRTNVTTAKPSALIDSLVKTQGEQHISRLIYVVDDNKALFGIISPYDILKLLLPEYLVHHAGGDISGSLKDAEDIFAQGLRSHRTMTAADLMTSDYYSLRPDDHCVKASILIVDKRINALPVLEHGGILVGEVTRRTILRHLAATLQAEEKNA